MLGLATVGLGLAQGFAFGTGYGAGVRFGYEDVYPYLKSNMSDIAKILNIPFASSGFKLASGVTAQQGMGLQDPSVTKNIQGGLGAPESTTPTVDHAGRKSVMIGNREYPIYPARNFSDKTPEEIGMPANIVAPSSLGWRKFFYDETLGRVINGVKVRGRWRDMGAAPL